MKKILLISMLCAMAAFSQSSLFDRYDVNMSKWAQLPENMPWGGITTWVAPDGKGTVTVMVRKAPYFREFSRDGKFIKAWGDQPLFGEAHAVYFDPEGTMWAVDTNDSAVYKFDANHNVVMTIGKRGVKGDDASHEAFNRPSTIAFGKNGDVYVAESHTDVSDPNLVGRISVFNKQGKFVRTIGSTGTGPGQFRTPHAIEFDSKGRLIVADRHNHRIQILTKAGKFVKEYDSFGRTSGLAIDKNDVIYTTDSESTERVHPGWQRGVRIGSLKDGMVTIFIPPHALPNSADGAMGEGMAVDAAGNVFSAETNLRGITKFVRQ